MCLRKLVVGNRAAASCIFVFLTFVCVSAAPAHELPRRPYLGVTGQLTPDNHVRVGKIFPNSPAARSELAVGDILLALNGTPVESVDGFLAGVKSLKAPVWLAQSSRWKTGPRRP